MVCDKYPTIECLVYVFDRSLDLKVRSKVLFCLKQLCAGQKENSAENKKRVGKHVISKTVQDMSGADGVGNIKTNKDWATNALMLLQLLTIAPENCSIVANVGKLHGQHNWDEAWASLQRTKMTELDATRDSCA